VRPAQAAPAWPIEGERAAEDQRGERVGDLAVGLQVGLNVLVPMRLDFRWLPPTVALLTVRIPPGFTQVQS
jgi:hypothetical protein